MKTKLRYLFLVTSAFLWIVLFFFVSNAIFDPISYTYQLTATANSGYTFAYWKNYENEVVSISNPYRIFSTSDIHLVAVFTPN